jgi:aryl-alcohol dehydrogenase-like predicted oxidoreductase
VQEGTRFGLARAGALYQRRYWTDEVFDVVERLAVYTEGRGKRLIHVALAWVLAQSGITSAIVGASHPEQLRESLGGINLALDDEELRACDDAWYSLPRQRDPSIAQR